jgi:hypothetical protein
MTWSTPSTNETSAQRLFSCSVGAPFSLKEKILLVLLAGAALFRSVGEGSTTLAAGGLNKVNFMAGSFMVGSFMVFCLIGIVWFLKK